MDIKYKIAFFLQKISGNTYNSECRIRMRVRWDDNIIQFNSGYLIHPDKWIAKENRCKRNTSNKSNHSAFQINKELERLEQLAIDVFKFFEVNNKMPTAIEFKDKFNGLNGKGTRTKIKRSIDNYFLEFMKEEGTINSWSDATFNKFNTLLRQIKEFNKGININSFTHSNLISFLEYLRINRDMQNVSILKSWKLLKWFLAWADKKDYIKCKEYYNFKPNLRVVTDKQIIFLNMEELMKVYNLVFPDDKRYLDRARDLFCFECFTSLRYSDIAKLERVDIVNDKITVVTKKTGDTVNIELNKYSKAILYKYKDDPKPLPIITNQKLNKYIKEVCFIAEINEPIKTVYYKGSERIEEIRPKYELIGTHTGRRTFISNALSLGIPPAVVMAWTGHSDYKAMQPYIQIADEAKKKEMNKFNEKF